MDSFSRDNFLGCISKAIDDIPETEVLEESMELLDDEIENISDTPTEVSGEAKVQFQILPIQMEPTGWFTFWFCIILFFQNFNECYIILFVAFLIFNFHLQISFN